MWLSLTDACHLYCEVTSSFFPAPTRQAKCSDFTLSWMIYTMKSSSREKLTFWHHSYFFLFNCLLHENSQRCKIVRADKSQFYKSILLSQSPNTSLRSQNWISTRHREVELLIKACTRISSHQNPLRSWWH